MNNITRISIVIISGFVIALMLISAIVLIWEGDYPSLALIAAAFLTVQLSVKFNKVLRKKAVKQVQGPGEIKTTSNSDLVNHLPVDNAQKQKKSTKSNILNVNRFRPLTYLRKLKLNQIIGISILAGLLVGKISEDTKYFYYGETKHELTYIQYREYYDSRKQWKFVEEENVYDYLNAGITSLIILGILLTISKKGDMSFTQESGSKESSKNSK